jgi:hypothetical protein
MAIVSFLTGETISAGDAVFVSASGLAFKAIANDSFENASVVGIAIDGGAQGTLIRVNPDSVYDSDSTFVPGVPQYLSASVSGAYASFEVINSGLINSSQASVYLSKIGSALTSSKIEIETTVPILLQNPTAVLLLEDNVVPLLNAILLEDGSRIDLETSL